MKFFSSFFFLLSYFYRIENRKKSFFFFHYLLNRLPSSCFVDAIFLIKSLLQCKYIYILKNTIEMYLFFQSLNNKQIHLLDARTMKHYNMLRLLIYSKERKHSMHVAKLSSSTKQ